ncbi:MAG TPA: phosphoenolpyruvate--protein phosphotransferase [Spirochaetota bacterium]|nr:phosphoenolpyruvate--protein phosphotransferase [Spirochaetota bacterium]HPI87799.1 phosphoenolpyruvate--protein phosphotransferase [Spirochaetota bacterium]HPR47025.1 phosphoenolpyruvate--protein phosphotransferase [Spirochaetota bacterium]
MQTDHVKMLCSIGELNSLFEETSLEDLLQRTVLMVADHMMAQVCSIYLYDEKSEELVLKATHGLNPDSVNSVRMNINEGLCGLSLRENRPICEQIGKNNPNFKPCPGTNEDDYEAFLVVPIIRGMIRIGVLVVQREKDRCFSDQDIMSMRATASQMASMLENIRLILAPQWASVDIKKPVDFSTYRFIKGKSASKEFASGPAYVAGQEKRGPLFIGGKQNRVYTTEDLAAAIRETERQFEELQEKVEQKLSDAASLIFSSHLLMLKDQGFTGKMIDMTLKGGSPHEAVVSVYRHYYEIFSKSESALIREKIEDIEDLTRRILANLADEQKENEIFSGHIIIARELFPSDLLKYSAMDIAGMILVSGGVTSHVSILARSLGIPLVFIDEPDLLLVPANTPLLLDADAGNLYINPSAEIVETFNKRKLSRKKIEADITGLAQPSATADGSPVKVLANINLLSDVSGAVPDIIDGIGLYRTEFPFIIRNTFPSEEEQYVIYTKLVQSMKGKPVTFRTLDIGGDKVLPYYKTFHEENPFLGLRSIRFSLKNREIFKQQIRAILRAGDGMEIKIMFPMISSLEEYTSAREITEECIKELKKREIPHNPDPRIGIMVEIPSAVTIIDLLAKESDFISIGTNDLIQYSLAVDRTNEKVSDLYIPHHPAVLRSLKLIVEAAIKFGKEVTVCGDMGSSETYIPFLLGIGMRAFSIDAAYIPRVKKAIRSCNVVTEKARAEKILSLRTSEEIEKILFT